MVQGSSFEIARHGRTCPDEDLGFGVFKVQGKECRVNLACDSQVQEKNLACDSQVQEKKCL